MTKIKTLLATGALSLISMTGQNSQAAIPQLQEVGGNYAQYLLTSSISASFGTIDANAILNALLPYGTNAAYYGYFASLVYGPYYKTEVTAQSIEAYYHWLGNYYAYQNYQYPAYAANLQAFYDDYGQDQSDAYVAAVSQSVSYYQSVAEYYSNVIFP